MAEKITIMPGVDYEVGIDRVTDSGSAEIAGLTGAITSSDGKEASYDVLKDGPIAQLSKTISEYAVALNARIEPSIQLKYPWVMVRVLPREQQVGSIIVPEAAQGIGQNKPMHEGIVIHTWKSFVKTWTKSGEEYSKQMLPTVNIGDHVLFHHWAGHDLYGFDKKEFRVVCSEDWSETKNGGIIATLDYDNRVDDVLFDLIVDNIDDDYFDDSSKIQKAIQARYQLIDKTKTSVTLSGR